MSRIGVPLAIDVLAGILGRLAMQNTMAFEKGSGHGDQANNEVRDFGAMPSMLGVLVGRPPGLRECPMQSLFLATLSENGTRHGMVEI